MVKRRRGRPKKASSETSMFGKVLPLLAPIAYGAIREKTSDMLASIPALQKLPATQFTDEAVMLGAIWGLRKLGVGKKGIGNSMLKAAKTVELARIGETLINMQQQKSQNAGNAF